MTATETVDMLEELRKEKLDELERALFITRTEEEQLCLAKLGRDGRHWMDKPDAIIAHAQQVTDERAPVFFVGESNNGIRRLLVNEVKAIELRVIDVHDGFQRNVAEMLGWRGPTGADDAWCELAREMFDDFALDKQRGDVAPDPDEEREEERIKPSYVAPFPTDVFPEAVQELIASISTAMSLTPHYSATHVLPVIATAARGKWWVHAKADQVMPPTIWNTVIGAPGFNKSAPFGVLRGPLLDRHKAQASRWRDEMAAWLGNGKDGPRPVQRRIVIDDATMEATKQALDENGDTLGMMRDELGGWIKDMDKYRSGAGGAASSDLSDWIKCWDGDMLEVTRRNTDACFFIEHAQVSISGAIQPSVARDCLVNTKASGFASRMLMSRLPYVPARWTEDVVDEKAIDEWRKIVEAVLDTKPSEDGGPVLLKSTAASRERYAEWVASFARQDFHNHCKVSDEGRGSVNAKLRTYVWRFAGLLAILEAAAAGGDRLIQLRNIELHHVNNAITLAEWWHARIMEIYASWEEGNEDAEDRQRVLTVLQTDEWKVASTVLETLRRGEGGIGWKRLNTMLAALESSGMARSRGKARGKGTEWQRVKQEVA